MSSQYNKKNYVNYLGISNKKYSEYLVQHRFASQWIFTKLFYLFILESKMITINEIVSNIQS